MKRLLILVLVLALLTLSACYRSADTKTPESEQPPMDVADTAADTDDLHSTPLLPEVTVNDRPRSATPVGSAERLTLTEQLTAFDSAQTEAAELPLHICVKWNAPLPKEVLMRVSAYYLDGDELICLEESMLIEDKRDRERSYFYSQSKWQGELPLDGNGDLAVALLLYRADTNERYVVTDKVGVDRPFYGLPVLIEGTCLDRQEYYFRYNQKLQDVEWIVQEMREKDTVLNEAFSKTWQELEAPFLEDFDAMVAKGEMPTIFPPTLLACIEDGVLTKEAYRAAENARETRHLSDEEIDLLFSGDRAAINAYFRSPFSLLANGKLYSGYWLGSQSTERYVEENLPLNGLKDLLAFYQGEAAKEVGEIGLIRLEALDETITAYEAQLNT